MSSVKPEVRNLSQCHQRRSEPQPQATSIKNLVKFSCTVFELCEWTDRQTHRQTNILITILWTPPPGGKVINAGAYLYFCRHQPDMSLCRKTPDMGLMHCKVWQLQLLLVLTLSTYKVITMLSYLDGCLCIETVCLSKDGQKSQYIEQLCWLHVTNAQSLSQITCIMLLQFMQIYTFTWTSSSFAASSSNWMKLSIGVLEERKDLSWASKEWLVDEDTSWFRVLTPLSDRDDNPMQHVWWNVVPHADGS